jgi:tRNA(adenine34) deaminase
MNNKFMDEAYREALKARDEDEVPIGAVIVKDGVVIARAHNRKEKTNDPLGHAEILCIRKACKRVGDWYLKDCELYVTLEPCLMCVGAIINSRIKKVHFGAIDKKGGAVGGLFNVLEQKGFNHYFEYEYIEESRCGAILSDYFKMKRRNYDRND